MLTVISISLQLKMYKLKRLNLAISSLKHIVFLIWRYLEYVMMMDLGNCFVILGSKHIEYIC